MLYSNNPRSDTGSKTNILAIVPLQARSTAWPPLLGRERTHTQMTLLRKTHPLLKIANNAVLDLPTPSNISIWWNFGSLLGLCLVSQILTGLFLAMHYTPDVSMAFVSVAHICRDVNYG